MGWVWKSLSASTAGIRKRVSKGCPVAPRTEGGNKNVRYFWTQEDDRLDVILLYKYIEEPKYYTSTLHCMYVATLVE
jgi:hypothetical protein